MSNDKPIPKVACELSEDFQTQLDNIFKGGARSKTDRFILAALSSIPWVGGVLSATSALDAEIEQGKVNNLLRLWVQEHEEKINKLGMALMHILSRLKGFGEEAQARLESPEYLDLVRKGFKAWNEAHTDEKRNLARNLLTNSGASKLCSDDVVRLFIDWINTFHEVHFMIIREIYNNPGITRGEIWKNIRGPIPRDDSADANLYKMLIHDLSVSEVIGQESATNSVGQLLKKPSGRRAGSLPVSKTKISPFDTMKSYFLTELGKQFAHYTMEDIAPQLEEKA